MIAHAEGRPPALAYALPPEDDGRPASLDLTLPDARRGGSVRVTVLRDGKPMAGVKVGLAPRDGPIRSTLPGFGVGLRSSDGDAVRALFRPTP